MKRKSVFISVSIIIIAVICIFLLTRPKPVGNIKHNYTEYTTSVSDISFVGEEGTRIKFSFRSDIQSGDLNIFLCDSEGDVVYELDRARALETYFTLNYSDTYTLLAECSDFIGTYNIKVYNVD